MCLAVPGRIVAIASAAPMAGPGDGHPDAPAQALGEAMVAARPEDHRLPSFEADLWRMATVDFGGVRQPVSLACLPEARLGDLVLVHVGLAICQVEESLLELTLEPIPESIPELVAPRLQEPMEAPTEAPTETATSRSPVAPPDPVRKPSTTLPAWAHRPEAEA